MIKFKDLPIKLKKEEYTYLLQILKTEEAVINQDIKNGNIEPGEGSSRLRSLLRIRHAVDSLDREK